MQNVVLFWGHLLPLQESSLICHITRNHAYIGAMKALQSWVATECTKMLINMSWWKTKGWANILTTTYTVCNHSKGNIKTKRLLL